MAIAFLNLIMVRSQRPAAAHRGVLSSLQRLRADEYREPILTVMLMGLYVKT